MRRSGRVCFAALLLGGSLIMFHKEVRFFFEKDPKLVAEVTEDFNNGAVQRPDLLASEGFVLKDHGWVLLPHTKGRLIYRSPWAVPPGWGVHIYLFFYSPSEQVHNALRLYPAGTEDLTTIAENLHLRGDRIDLSPYLASGGAFDLVFEATNDAPSAHLILDDLRLRMFEGRPPVPPSPSRMFLGFLLCSLALALFTPGWKRTLPFVLMLSAGFYIRYANFEWVIYTPLDPDAGLYRSFADRMTLWGERGFYSGNFSVREPFFIFLAKLLFGIFGSSDTHLRLLSLLLSLGVIYVVYRLAVDLVGPGWGLVACSATGLNLLLARESVRGLRLELEMVLLVLLCHIAFVKRELAPFRRFVLLGVMGGLVVLTRHSHLPGLVLLLLYAAWRHGRQAKQRAATASLALLLMGLLLAPHKYSLYQRHGDPFWDTNMHTRWSANWEFVGRPGFPTRAELEKDSYVGAKLTYFQYLLELHTPAEAVIGTLRGLLKIAARMNVVGFKMRVPALGGLNPGWTDDYLTALGAIGFFVALCSAELRWVPLAFLSLIFPVSFLFDRGLTEPYRHTMQGFPFFLLCGLLALRQAYRWATPAAVRQQPLGQPQDTFRNGLVRGGSSFEPSRRLPGILGAAPAVLFRWLGKGYPLWDSIGLRLAPRLEFIRWVIVAVAFASWNIVLTSFLGSTATFRPVSLTAAFLVGRLVVAPLFEELLFRGFLLEGLRRSPLGPTAGVALTAFGWSVSHLERGAVSVAGTFILGLILGHVRLRTGSTLLVIAMHAVNNFVGFLLAVLFFFVFH